MTRRRLFFFLSAASLLATATRAAPVDDPRIPSWEQSHFKAGDASTRALYILAVCIRNHRLEQAEAMLRARPGTPEERAAVPLVRPQDECLMRTTELKIRNLDLLRGALAEAIYNGRRVQPLSTGPLPLNVQALMPRNEKVPRERSIGRLTGACAVERAPAHAHAVVQSNPGDIGEFRALKALESTFASCLPTGTSLRVSRLGIRASIAEALYHAWRARTDLFKGRAAP